MSKINRCTLLVVLWLQRSIRPQVVTTFELPGCTDMWTVVANHTPQQTETPSKETETTETENSGEEKEKESETEVFYLSILLL